VVAVAWGVDGFKHNKPVEAAGLRCVAPMQWQGLGLLLVSALCRPRTVTVSKPKQCSVWALEYR
jgi:hypothetical protein